MGEEQGWQYDDDQLTYRHGPNLWVAPATTIAATLLTHWLGDDWQTRDWTTPALAAARDQTAERLTRPDAWREPLATLAAALFYGPPPEPVPDQLVDQMRDTVSQTALANLQLPQPANRGDTDATTS